MRLGWIFHVTDYANAQSIQQKRLILDFDKGKGGRDAAHFMYQLYQNGQGSTQFPRHYRRPVYFVLLPDFWRTQHLLLTRNGVVL